MTRAASAPLAWATVIAAALAIAGALLAPAAPWADWLLWFGKPLATACILVLALRAQPAVSARYRRFIALGLGCSLLGDVLLMLPGDLFVPGLVAFLVAHLCYLRAFFTLGVMRRLLLPLLATLGFGAACVAALWTAIAPPLRPAVIAYVAVLASMAGVALARARMAHGDRSARLAAVGALLFMLSDALLAWDRFRGPLPLAPLWILATYYAAQWRIARSTSAAEGA